jgi:hypothetical protein
MFTGLNNSNFLLWGVQGTVLDQLQPTIGIQHCWGIVTKIAVLLQWNDAELYSITAVYHMSWRSFATGSF